MFVVPTQLFMYAIYLLRIFLSQFIVQLECCYILKNFLMSDILFSVYHIFFKLKLFIKSKFFLFWPHLDVLYTATNVGLVSKVFC